jgi:hypothetical protein
VAALAATLVQIQVLIAQDCFLQQIRTEAVALDVLELVALDVLEFDTPELPMLGVI